MLILGGNGVEGCGQHHGGFSSEDKTSTRSHFFRINLVDHEAKRSAVQAGVHQFIFYYFGLASVFNY
jgi:hypothetical protein